MRSLAMKLIPLGVLGGKGGVVDPTIIYDTFTDVDNTLLPSHVVAPTNKPGASWVAYGTWSIISNAAERSTNDGLDCALIETGAANVVLESLVELYGVANLAIRGTDKNNVWFATIYSPGGGVMRINEVTTGSVVIRASKSISLTDGSDYQLRARANGTLLQFLVNGENLLEYTSSVRQTVTKHGIAASSVLISHDPKYYDFKASPL